MIEKIQKTIEKYHMLCPGQSVVAAVSGGPDSVAMLDCLMALGYKPIVTHVNHMLRGEDADGDEDFVRRLAQGYSVPIHVKRADVRAIAKQKGVSIEEAGRGVRYLFFGEVMAEANCLRTALAHHRDDQAETVLQHMLRGSGPEGLKGMAPVRDGVFIRPLLYVSREEILAYCEERGLAYREDASNDDTSYQRNSIRHELLPQLEDYNPRIRDALCRTAEIMREEDACMAGYTGRIYDELAVLADEHILLPVDTLGELPLAMMRRVIRRAIEDMGGTRDIGYDHIGLVAGLIGEQGGAVQLPGRLRIEVRENDLHFMREGEETPCPPYAYPLPVPGSAYIPEAGAYIVCEETGTTQFDENTVCVDADKIQGVLTVRNRRPGDRFHPYNGPGTKKLKDFLIGSKIPRAKRDRLPLVTDERGIVWVAGVRTGDEYRVDNETRNMIKISIYCE